MDIYQQNFKVWDEVASLYQDTFMDVDLYDDTYDLFCELITKTNPKIFEIGCGPGNITRYLLKKRPDFLIDAIDVSPSMISLAEKNNPAAAFKVMDCREIGSIPTKYDAVICGFCIPYLSKEDCAIFIKDCHSLLNPSGIFYFSTLEGDHASSGYLTSSNGKHTMYVYYHQEDYLLQFLEANNLSLIKKERKLYKKANGVTEQHLIIVSKKNEI
jgi:2-polyprenyl-3-methyl-5-hydroxy-6-metoxy-1,4-benzoquinol methylase